MAHQFQVIFENEENNVQFAQLSRSNMSSSQLKMSQQLKEQETIIVYHW